MREERLTERIRSWNRAPDRRGRPDPKRMIDSIVRHLERILNTRWGSAQIADDYGIPDFTALRSGLPDAIRDLERAIRNTIQKYEPRLEAVRVKFIPQEETILTVSFQIVARLAVEGEKNPVTFQSVMDSDGKVTIRG
ncbi:MAG: type VI secretion system baseplate subunit TssE [Deltaproteobacteria bacterium]|nr:type VI secretion system baseplate subunit TssE [Pseudomonadota bacterium]NIO11557.1 type VI secretion system baseplate subunit TssE [Deltaproteobacteria bacterium]NIS69394.1 type VI secretion system baseplate subunit TssE [Pseudomonadota bacterium]